MAIAYQNFFNIDFHKIFHAYCKVCMLLPLPPMESACNLKNVCPLPSQQFFSFRYLFVFQYCFHIVHTFSLFIHTIYSTKLEQNILCRFEN